jgi:hypothetical protein
VLGEVWRGSFLPRGSTAIALDLLFGQRIESRVPVALPPGSRRAPAGRALRVHKTGELRGGENDAGLVLLPGRTFALAVLVEGGVERALPTVAAVVTMICGALAACR